MKLLMGCLIVVSTLMTSIAIADVTGPGRAVNGVGNRGVLNHERERKQHRRDAKFDRRHPNGDAAIAGHVARTR